MDTKEISKRLRIIKTMLGLDQQQLADKLNVSQNAVSNYLNGRVPKWEHLIKIIELAHESGDTNITMDWIIFGGSLPAKPYIGVSEPEAKYDSDKKINYIIETITKSDIQKDIIYEYLTKGRNTTLFEKLNRLSDQQLDTILKLIDQLNVSQNRIFKP